MREADNAQPNARGAVNILVAIKQVPKADAPARLDADARPVAPERAAFVMNEYDEHALEAALRLREALGRGRIVAASVGPERVAIVLRRAVGMGADDAVHLCASDDAADDPAFVAAALAGHATANDFDLVVCGAMSADSMHGVVAPMLAAFLDRPCLTNVVELSVEGGEVVVVRELEGGARERFAVRPPLVVSMQTGPEAPRYPRLSLMLRADRAAIPTIDAGGSATALRVMAWETPQPTRRVRFLDGDAAAKARTLVEILRRRGVLKEAGR